MNQRKLDISEEKMKSTILDVAKINEFQQIGRAYFNLDYMIYIKA